MAAITLDYPWLLLGIPLCYLLLFFRNPRHTAPAFSQLIELQDIPRSFRQILRPYILHTLLALCIGSLFTGAARPQRILFSESDKHRNIMLAVDVSPSMQAEDIRDNTTAISRMDAIKKVLSEFIDARPDDRIGLAIFSGRAFLESPLTTDHPFLQKLVSELQPGLAGDGTAIGDGLGVALKRVQELPADTRSIILMTDGANNAGKIDPATCGTIAKSLGIKIHTIGIGGDTQARVPGGIFGLLAPMAEYDETLLKGIASTTGGIYFNAGSINKLRDIYSQLDALLTSEFQDTPRKITYEYYPTAAWGAFLTFALLVILSKTIFKRTGGSPL